MRIARVTDGSRGHTVVVEEDGLRPCRLTADGRIDTADRLLPEGAYRRLAPCRPGKIVAVGRNYSEHARELDNTVPDEPLLFLKPPSAVVGPEAAVEYPAETDRLDYEGELVVVVGRRCRHLTAADVADVVLGCTCGNDITARDLQSQDDQWTRAKGYDTFAPLGPHIVTDFDPAGEELITTVNGEERQRSSFAQMIFGITDLLVYVSGVMTLEPWDVIYTGTPAGVGPLSPGDEVTVEVTGIGRLHNTVAGG